jgi:hypothetical protein
VTLTRSHHYNQRPPLSFPLQSELIADGDALLDDVREKALLKKFGVTTSFQINRHVNDDDKEDTGLPSSNIAGQDHHQEAVDDTFTTAASVSSLGRGPDDEDEEERALFEFLEGDNAFHIPDVTDDVESPQPISMVRNGDVIVNATRRDTKSQKRWRVFRGPRRTLSRLEARNLVWRFQDEMARENGGAIPTIYVEIKNHRRGTGRVRIATLDNVIQNVKQKRNRSRKNGI